MTWERLHQALAGSGDVAYGLSDLVGLSEFAYLVMLFTIFVIGPGKASIDELIARAAARREPRARPREEAFA